METKLDHLIGKSSIDVIQHIVSGSKEIEFVSYVGYNHPALLQERISPSTNEQGAIQRALEIRKSHHLPFWDSIFLALFSDCKNTDELLSAAGLHQSLRGREEWVSKLDVENGRLLTTFPRNSEYVGFCSEVRLRDGIIGHIPMLDFHYPVKSGHALASKICSLLFPFPAVILDSGKSFHAYGLSVVSTDNLRQMLLSALLYTPAIDKGYVAHQLMESRCVLRINQTSAKPTHPHVVGVVT